MHEHVTLPLIMPGPPRRMLIGAILAAAMGPLALLVLDLWGKVATDADGYLQAVVSSAFAVGFAFMGARVVYGRRRPRPRRGSSCRSPGTGGPATSRLR